MFPAYPLCLYEGADSLGASLETRKQALRAMQTCYVVIHVHASTLISFRMRPSKNSKLAIKSQTDASPQ